MALHAQQPSPSPAPPLLELRDATKRFGGVKALCGANLTISGPGVVHGLIGENGSGKSTLLGILSGQLSPDEGQLLIGGEPVSFRTPAGALERGIAMVSQETALAMHLTVAENIFLGHRAVKRASGIDWAATEARAAGVLERLALEIEPGRLVGELAPDQQQMVEIARALSMDARILILDEPTSSLTDDEVESLFKAVRGVRAAGVSVVFVSHRLGEMFAIVDELTVLRDGLTAATGPMSDFDVDGVIDAMVGSSGSRRDLVARGAADRVRTMALEVRGLRLAGATATVDLDVARGEIVGIAGLVGAGRSELLEAIFGVRPIEAGDVRIHGESHGTPSPRAAIAGGVGYLPPDRKVQGLVLRRSVRENVTMAMTSSAGRLRSPHDPPCEEAVADVMQRMRIRAASPDVAVATLSGGNQQKVALGKWIAAGSRVLLLDEPTRGVDVNSKADIHELLRAAADDGVALLVSSSDNPELLELCDRILVMFRGSVVASVAAADASEAVLGRYAGGHL